MYALLIGVQRMDEIPPAEVYAVLSGLNTSAVGIIALAAVQLAAKAIRDKLSHILVIPGACTSLCYNALLAPRPPKLISLRRRTKINPAYKNNIPQIGSGGSCIYLLLAYYMM